MDDRQDKAAEYRELAQQLVWIADLLTRDDARKILSQVAAEYRDRACRLEEIMNAEEAMKKAPKVRVLPSRWTGQPRRRPNSRG